MSDSALPIVDAHQHFWDLSLGRHPWLRGVPPAQFRYGDTTPLRRDYLPADYRRDCAGHRVVRTVYVEAEWDPQDPLGETRWVSALSAAEGLPSAVVAQAWLDRADAAQVLGAQAAFALVRGVRHKPPAAPGSMNDPAWRAGYALLERHGLHFELQAPWQRLHEAAALASAFPRTRLVLNHTGLPADRGARGLAGWRAGLRALADCPNAMLKISGLGLPGQPWRVADHAPVVREAIALFGVRRCMFASNFPVDSLVAPLDAIFSGFKAITADFSAAERAALFHDNARQVYRIGD